MNRLERAREVVRRYPLPKALRRLGKEEDWLPYFGGLGTNYLSTDLTSDVVAQSLHYMIKIKLDGIRDESDAPLGASKYKGLPHLPRGTRWPRGRYFLAQFNLSELHPHDLYDAFPAEGMLYIFFDPGGEVKVIHYDGPLDQLEVAPYPDSANKFNGAKYYLDGFRRRSATMRFRPRVAFYLGGDAYDLSTAKDLLPKDLRNAVAEVVGCSLTSRDTDCRVFGRPMYWQGEDDRLDDEDDSADNKRHLLFQDEFGEGHVHVFIDEADARERDYSRCWLDYSGT